MNIQRQNASYCRLNTSQTAHCTDYTLHRLHTAQTVQCTQHRLSRLQIAQTVQAAHCTCSAHIAQTVQTAQCTDCTLNTAQCTQTVQSTLKTAHCTDNAEITLDSAQMHCTAQRKLHWNWGGGILHSLICPSLSCTPCCTVHCTGWGTGAVCSPSLWASSSLVSGPPSTTPSVCPTWTITFQRRTHRSF